MNIKKSNLSIMENQVTSINSNILKNEIKENKFKKNNFENIIGAIIKRIIDLFAGILGMFFLFPILFFVIIFNIINKDKGPIFFSQDRIGKNGKIFKMYKFRTMVVDAEEILKKHIEEETDIGKEYIEHKKIKNDPRITKIGKFLRETSLDEFPQFLNVIKGQMSLVGPRPYLPREKEDMGEYYNYIIQMKPGVTGPWQVAGRNELEFNDRLKLDKEYYNKSGNICDIKIVLKTILKVIKKEGAI